MMLPTFVFTSLIVTLYAAQQKSLQIGRTEMLFTQVFTSLIVAMYLEQETSL